jgi:hypothetical protein
MLAVRRVVAFVACLAVLVSACGGSSDPEQARFEESGAPFAFDYPNAFSKVFTPQKQIVGRNPTFQVLYGTDDLNWVLAATYDTKKAVDLADPTDQSRVDLAAKSLGKATGWAVGDRQSVKLGPLPAFAYALEKIDEGREGRLVYAFNGPTQYFLRCEWDVDGQAVIPGGCDQVQRTLVPLAGAPAASGSSTGPAASTAPASSSG